jgi:hypothetical protein
MMEIEHHRIINTAIHAYLPDHVFGEKFSDRFTAAFIPLGLCFLMIGITFRLGPARLIRMSGSSCISHPASALTDRHPPGTTRSDSGQGNARRA